METIKQQPCSECGMPVYVDHLDPQLPSPIRNAADGTKHTCHVLALWEHSRFCGVHTDERCTCKEDEVCA